MKKLVAPFLIIASSCLFAIYGFGSSTKIITIKPGDKTIIVDGSRIILDATPQVIGGKLFVPLSVFSQVPGTKQEYNAKTKTATITTEVPELYFDYELKKPLLELIGKSKKIDLELYRLSDPEIINALKTSASKGVKIRIILDKHPENKTFEGGGDTEKTLEYGNQNNCTVKWLSGVGYKSIMHRKLGIFDGNTIFVGSSNWTSAALKKDDDYNREASIIFKNKNTCSKALKEFDANWTNSKDTYTQK
ncbi:MAG: phospholipase D-like domain-containing protein [Caldisericales bacterium]|nr:phospholipase D-like domain-containing protein [bacterium]